METGRALDFRIRVARAGNSTSIPIHSAVGYKKSICLHVFPLCSVHLFGASMSFPFFFVQEGFRCSPWKNACGPGLLFHSPTDFRIQCM
ncbi:hypothetical protein CEXT_331941 [Caerostris extrusa]|uniref:Uncharacterized protein n=1 Tax=Caerostris extrusa TaxID=172846 RepID=A0AAV4VS78_CAEEX|nr:hypothetical protein CEXT_331941 [Caerostris extrusa]